MARKFENTSDYGADVRRNPEDFRWLTQLIRTLRPDLRKLFKTENGVSLEFAKWLLLSGQKEYQLLREDNYFKKLFSTPIKVLGITPLEALIYLDRPDVQKAFPLPQERTGFHQWFLLHGIDEHKMLDFLNEETRRQYYALHPEAAPYKDEATAANDSAKKFGVNLIGYAYGQLGIGEDLRMTARALRQAGVPFTIINFPPGNDIPQNDMSMAEYVGEDAPYKINIFCMTALETGRFFAEKGKELFTGRYNIGYWPWELAKWPEEWRNLTDLVDEVWVSTRHIYDSLSPISPVPVLIMPLAVETGPIAALDRKDFGLPEGAYLFCFSFDLNSSIYRKNPQASLKAFTKAFPVGAETDKPVGLVIKCHQPRQANRNWDQIKAAAQADNRIHVIEQTLSRPDLMALYNACDCYLSLHRAEGFGRGIAECLLLGLDVIATGYSGNVDFCGEYRQARLATYKLIPVGPGQYPFGDGQYWAEADLSSVVALMRECAATSRCETKNFEPSFGLKTAGKRYRQRLKIIGEGFF